jgi:hypothetical protein
VIRGGSILIRFRFGFVPLLVHWPMIGKTGKAGFFVAEGNQGNEVEARSF